MGSRQIIVGRLRVWGQMKEQILKLLLTPVGDTEIYGSQV